MDDLHLFVSNMRGRKMKRAVVLLGAGASIDYDVPSTDTLTGAVEREVKADRWMKHIGGDAALSVISGGLKAYLHQDNFGHISHCAHELMFTYPSRHDSATIALHLWQMRSKTGCEGVR